jgi:hypothetical protein
MINDNNKRRKLNDALAIINDMCLTREEAYELFATLNECINGGQPTRGMCALKRIDYEKAIGDYWDGIYKAPRICVWAEESGDENEKKEESKGKDRQYIAVKQSSYKDDGDTFEAIKDGLGLPPIGYKYVRVME